jgi:hypothetical protein
LYEKIFRNHAEDFIPLMIDGTVYAIDTDIDIINKDLLNAVTRGLPI